MRRVLALIAAVALLMPFTGLAVAANGGSGDTAAGPHAFGRVLIGESGGGPIGWIKFDLRPATNANPVPGYFQFDALPGVTGYPVTTRSAIGGLGWYHEDGCCGYPDVAFIYGVECLYYSGTDYYCHNFTAAFFDGGPGTSHDFIRWGEAPVSPPPGWEPPEYWTGAGDLTVNLGPPSE